MEHLLKSALEELNLAYQSGDRNKARLLLRLFAALVPSNALHASSVLKTLTNIVETAIEIADTGQPWLLPLPKLLWAGCLSGPQSYYNGG